MAITRAGTFNAADEASDGVLRIGFIDSNSTTVGAGTLTVDGGSVLIDADTDGTAGNQAFKFIGATAFSGVDGQLRFAGGVLQGDVNGDRTADIEIRVVGALARGDLIL
jgi:hypothetical protein